VINVDPAAQAQALTQSVGDKIGRMIAEQQQLEQRFEELVAAQQELRHQPNKIKVQANEVRLTLHRAAAVSPSCSDTFK
jgi:hypothetical protein